MQKSEYLHRKTQIFQSHKRKGTNGTLQNQTAVFCDDMPGAVIPHSFDHIRSRN